MQASNITSFAQFVAGIQLLYGFLILGLSGFGVVSAFMETGKEGTPSERILLVAALGLTIVTVLPTVALHGRLLQGALDRARERSIHDRFGIVMGQKIVAAALVEGPGLFWIVLTILTGNPLYLIGGGACVFFLMLLFPTRDDLQSKLGLDASEIDRQLQPSGSDESPRSE